MADFAFRLKDQLNEVNKHSFNNFNLRAGTYTILNFIIFRALSVKNNNKKN